MVLGHISRTTILAGLTAGVVLFPVDAPSAMAQADGGAQPRVIGGTNDRGGPAPDAVVFLGVERNWSGASSGVVCTGTLIAPKVIVTAGHCIASGPPRPTDPQASNGCSDWQVPGRWYKDYLTVPVRIGRDKDDPEVFKTTARHMSHPTCTDMIALALDEPVPAHVARPVDVYAEPLPLDDLALVNRQLGDTFEIAGWGARDECVSPSAFGSIRQVGEIRGPLGRTAGLQLSSSSASPAAGLKGDSGGPVFANLRANGGRRTLVGVIRQCTGTGSTIFTPLFVGGLPEDNGRPKLGPWITRLKDCNGRVDFPIDTSGTVPLFSWYSGERHEYFVTTDPLYSADPRKLVWDLSGEFHWKAPRTSDGKYKMIRTEGYVFDPHRPQPPGTVPLFSWWSSARKDNFASTDPRWRMSIGAIRWDARRQHITNGPTSSDGVYTLYRLEGYLFDPKRPQPPGTIPVYSWWSSTDADNQATTHPAWSMDPRRVRWAGEHLAEQRERLGYKMYRLEGYAFDRRQVAAYCQ